MELTNNLLLVLRDYVNKKGQQALCVRAIVKGKPSYEDTGIRLEKNQWDQTAQKVIGHKNAGRLTGEAHKKLVEVDQLFQDAARRGEHLSRIPKQRPPANFIQFCRRRLDEQKDTHSPGTWRKYNSFVALFAEWRPELPFHQVDARLLKQFEVHERKERGNVDNTLHKKLGYVLAEAEAAAKEGWINPEKLKDYTPPPYTNPKREYLTKEEVDALENFSASTQQQRLRKVCDWFLFSCYSGLRYSDVKAFAPAMIDGGVVRLTMVKTGLPVEVPLHPRMRAVLERMDPGVYSNQKCNDYLKVIADGAGIEKNLTMHVGRHTYAVLHLDAGGSLEVLQELLGQKSINTTKIYGKITSQRKAQEVNNVWGNK